MRNKRPAFFVRLNIRRSGRPVVIVCNTRQIDRAKAAQGWHPRWCRSGVSRPDFRKSGWKSMTYSDLDVRLESRPTRYRKKDPGLGVAGVQVGEKLIERKQSKSGLLDDPGQRQGVPEELPRSEARPQELPAPPRQAPGGGCRVRCLGRNLRSSGRGRNRLRRSLTSGRRISLRGCDRGLSSRIRLHRCGRCLSSRVRLRGGGRSLSSRVGLRGCSRCLSGRVGLRGCGRGLSSRVGLRRCSRCLGCRYVFAGAAVPSSRVRSSPARPALSSRVRLRGASDRSLRVPARSSRAPAVPACAFTGGACRRSVLVCADAVTATPKPSTVAMVVPIKRLNVIDAIST